MKNRVKIIVGIIIALFIVVGLIVPMFISDINLCEKRGCFCQNDLSEIPCNSCSISKPIFITGILNVWKTCSGKEIILCDNNKKVGVKYDINFTDYRLTFNIFGLDLNRKF